MRRPTPLPPPPAPRTAPADSAPALEVSPRFSAPLDLDETAPIAPLWTTDEQAHDARVDTADAVESTGPALTRRADLAGDADGAADLDAETALTVRDVWAAARARRKALRAEVRRFTARQRRRRRLWLGTGAAVVALVLGSLGAAYSPLFAVERIRVVGTSTLDAADVAAALSAQRGTPLPLVDSSAVKAALVAFPLVESYTLEARPPHELVVRIVERTPVGALKSAAGYTLVDAAGVALSTTQKAPKDHPVITVRGGVQSAAFAAIGHVFRALPDDIRAKVTGMKATTPNDVTLTFGDTDTDVVWGNADRSERKAIVLEAAMKARPPAKVYSYDVSSPESVVIR